MSSNMLVVKCPSDALSMTNRVVVHKDDWDPASTPHLQVSTGPGLSYIMSTVADPGVARGTLGFGVTLRKWAVLSLGQQIQVPHSAALRTHTKFRDNLIKHVS